jgi:hypothetical protein
MYSKKYNNIYKNHPSPEDPIVMYIQVK